MPAPLELDRREGTGANAAALGAPAAADRRAARAELRRQIARLERELGDLFATTFPRHGIEWSVAAVGGPRPLGLDGLERTRDALVARLSEARSEVARRAERERAGRDLVERMTADPGAHRWVRVRSEELGERGCRHWHSRPRWGVIGMLLGWWRVKLSSGCPLATGPR